MFTRIQRLRYLAAPICAAVLIAVLFFVEDRRFDRNSSLLFALVTGVVITELLPAASLALVLAALVLQTLSVFPMVIFSGVLSYTAVPAALYFATRGWKARHRWLIPCSAVVFAALTTANWFNDTTWINYVFGTQIYGRGFLRRVQGRRRLIGKGPL